MRVKKTLILLLLFFSIKTIAENHVINLNITTTEKTLNITPSLDFQTSDDIKEAIDNGIRITIIAKAQLFIPHSLWFDETLENKKINYEISYFTLSELYVVKNLTTGEQQAFNNYQQLWEDIEKYIQFEMKTLSRKNLWVKTRIMLDKTALPTAMQLPVLFNSNWDVNTPWYKQAIENK